MLAPVRHQSRSSRVRAHQPAAGHRGGALRPLQPELEEPPPSPARRVPRRRRGGSAGDHRCRPGACLGPLRPRARRRTATTWWRSSRACTSPASRCRSRSPRRSSGDVSPPTSSSRRATSRTRTVATVTTATSAISELLASPLGADVRAGDGPALRHVRRASRAAGAHLDETLPREADEKARKRAIRALALDLMRGLLPAGTVSNVGMFASPQAYEQLVLRLRAHPLPEARGVRGAREHRAAAA